MTDVPKHPLANRHIMLIGAGYAALEFARMAISGGGKVSATLRDPAKADTLRACGITAVDVSTGPMAPDALAGVTDLLISTPPANGICPGLALAEPALGQATDLGWIGYFSSTAVYGDCNGEWIDETRAPAPHSADAKGRMQAEEGWTAVATRTGAACDILRIAGIYGPGRNLLATLRDGKGRAFDKPGQVFNRIHRDDIAGAALAAMMNPSGLRVTNLADGNPCSTVDLNIGLAEMLGVAPPQIVPFDPDNLPPGVAQFFAENRRLRNDRLLALPGFQLRYPDWQAGYKALLTT